MRWREVREVQLMLQLWGQLVLKDEALYRKQMVSGEFSYELVLPQSYRKMALEGLHIAIGHMGAEYTMAKFKQGQG